MGTNEPDWLESLRGVRATTPRLMRSRFGVTGIKTINTLLPHLHEDTRSKIFNGLPNLLDFRKCIFPDCSLMSAVSTRETDWVG
jgi:hypothetical protein